jgi:gas vesicle protein
MAQRTYYSQDAKIEAQRKQSFLMILFTTLGLVIGALIALLFAPKDGEELREDLREQVSTTRNHVEDYSEHVKDAISQKS